MVSVCIGICTMQGNVNNVCYINKCINSVVYYTFIVKLTVHELPEGRNCSCAGRSGAQSSVASTRR